MVKILISAGEASGDVHAAAVTAAIKSLAPDAEVYGMGGEALRQAGGEVLFDIGEHGVMGFVEVLRKLPALFKLRAEFIKVMETRRPDCFLVIDYPDFNMRLAKAAHARGIPVISYISPSAWAWRRGRARDVAKIVDKVAAIFPFEYDVYHEAGADTVFVGHPLLDIVRPEMERSRAESWAGKRPGRKLLLLMPGSRLMEIEKMLPVMLQAAEIIRRELPEVDFALPRAATIPVEAVQEKLQAVSLDVKITEGHNYDLFSVADLALATSGTVTLEAALCGLGSVILYRTSPISAFIARRVIKISDIGLPNIVMGRRILPELLQEDYTPSRVAAAALELLQPERNARMRRDLACVRAKLGEPGAVRRVAELVLQLAGEKK